MIAETLSQCFSPGSAVVIGLDSYYRDLSTLTEEEKNSWNFDRPDALDVPLLLQQMRELAAGREIIKPVYRYPSHTRAAEGVRIAPGRYVLIEGLFALYWQELRSIYALRVFVEAQEDVCLERRLIRDERERGFSRAYIRWQYETSVKPMYAEHVLPTRQWADVILDGEQPPRKSVDRLLDSLTCL